MVNRPIEVPVFHPTLRDVSGSFETYIASIEKKFAKAGVCKIIPPKGWTPRKAGYADDFDYTITRPIKQHATGRRGLYRTLLVEQKPMSLAKDFRPQAVNDDSLPPAKETPEEVERRFWRNVTLRPPLYGADVPGSLFDEDLKGWNLRHLDSLLSRTLEKKKLAIPGVSTPYLYFGMWRSIFAWHTEDMDLASVNFLHYGAPKSWYCIPPAHRERFERVLQGLLPDMFRACPEFLRHKELLVSPYLLLQNNIPVVRCTQYPGEFIINYPGAYHSGFNHGYNCAESTNFATKSWIEVGVQAGYCDCQKDSVAIQMSLFMDEAAPRVRRMIREAEASSSDDDSGSGSASDSESGSDDEESDSDAESSEEEAEQEAKPAKRKRAAAKPLVRGGRGMAAVVHASGKGGGAAAARPAPAKKPAAAKPKAAAAGSKKPAAAAKKPAAATRKPPQAPAVSPMVRKPPVSRKPVGTVSRAVGKRGASLPARLRPQASPLPARSPAAAAKGKAGAARQQQQQQQAGRKRAPVSANLRSVGQEPVAKRARTGSAAAPKPTQRAQQELDAAKAAAARRVVQRASRQPSPAKGGGHTTMLRRVLKLTAKAAEAAVGLLGGSPQQAGRGAASAAAAHATVVPSCTVRIAPKAGAAAGAPGSPNTKAARSAASFETAPGAAAGEQSPTPRSSPRTGSSGTPQRSASKSPVPKVVPRRPRTLRAAAACSSDDDVSEDDGAAQKLSAGAKRPCGPDMRSAKARKYIRINA